MSLPEKEFRKLLAKAEELEDIKAFDRAMKKIKTSKAEFVPFEQVLKNLPKRWYVSDHIWEVSQKKLYKFPATIRDKIIAKIKALASDPRPSGCKKLTGRPGYRIRIDDYRVIYLIEDGKLTVLVVDVGDRKNIYE